MLQCDYTPLVVEQNNYAPRTVNVYIVYELDYWPRVQLRNFTLKNCLSGVTNIVENSDREKYMHSGYGLAFDGKGSWSFNDDFTWNVITFEVDSSQSSYTDNPENDFLILGKRYILHTNNSFGATEKRIFILVKQKQNIAWVCIIIVIIVTYL